MAITLLAPFNFCVPGDILDTDTDLIKVPVPGRNGSQIRFAGINTMLASNGTGTISVQNTAGGLDGSALVVTFSNGEYYAEGSGSTTLDRYVWIRSGTPSDLADINITLWLLNG